MTTTVEPGSRFGRLARAALTVSAGSAVGRVLGLVREQTIAGLFGRNAATDAFTAASRVPTTTYDLLVGGMISAAFVPVLSTEAEKDQEAFWRLVGLLATVFFSILAVGVVGLYFLAPALVGIISPGFEPETAQLTLVLLQIMAPSLLFLGLSGLAVGVLQSRRKFAAPAFGAAAFNIAFIVIAWLFREQGVTALAGGILAGAAAQLGLQVYALRGGNIRPNFAIMNPALRRIGALYVPVLVGLVVSSAGVLIDTNLASRLQPGDLSAMRYATTLSQFTLGLVATAIGTAYLPELARSAIGARSSYASSLGEALRAVLVLIVPAAVALAALREPVIRVLFQRGVFGAEDTARTALAFLTYSPGIPAAAIDQILIYAFYAKQDTIKPVTVGIVAVGVYLVTALTLIQPLGMVGLTLANSAQWTSHALIMAVLAAWALRPVPFWTIVASLGRVLIAGGVAALVWVFAGGWLAGRPGLPWQLGGLILAGGLGFAAYLGVLLVLKSPEVAFLRAKLLQRRGGQP